MLLERHCDECTIDLEKGAAKTTNEASGSISSEASFCEASGHEDTASRRILCAMHELVIVLHVPQLEIRNRLVYQK